MAHQAALVPRLIPAHAYMLAWDMGVGKTAPLARAWENSPEHGPMLVLCLASARENWRREILRFTIDPDVPPRVQVIRSSADRVDTLTDAAIVNYDKLLIPQVAKMLRSRRWGALVLDEAHVLRTADAERTRLVYGLGSAGKGKCRQEPLIKSAARVWAATGTPMPNHPGELWTHARALFPGSIEYRGRPMEQWEFEARYCQVKMSKYGPQIVGGQHLDELRQRMSPYMDRLKRCDVLSLPPLSIETWPLDVDATGGGIKRPDGDIPELLGTLAERYGSPDKIDTFDAAMLDAYLACIAQAGQFLATIRRETATLKALASGLTLAEELDATSHKVVVFAYHREAIATLEKVLAPYAPAVIHGGIGDRDRVAAIDRFHVDPRCRVFIGQITAAGASINLQNAASEAFFVEASWCPSDNEQAIARVYRNGQTKPVRVRFAYLHGSIDEPVSRALCRKTAMISQVIN
jgi:SNF2 family DNA or RNA helicase